MQFSGLIGMVCLIGIAFALSSARKRVPWRMVAIGLGLQLALAVLLMKVPAVVVVFNVIAKGFTKLLSFAGKGAEFLFGPELMNPGGPWGFVFAFQVLPVIIFFAALMGLLYYLRVMQVLITALAWVLRKTLGVTGVEALAASANVFVGQTEAPLCVRPYLERMTRSQLMVIMTTGFATIAGSVLAAYVSILGAGDEARELLFAKHLLMASVMSAPGAFVMAKIMVPETETPFDEGSLAVETSGMSANALDATAQGATDGLKLALNVGAMLVAFVALIALIDWPLSAIGAEIASRTNSDFELSLEIILGWLFTPAAWAMGLFGDDSGKVGALLGTSVVATEFLAYLKLGGWIENGEISPRAAEVVTFGLCGFANLPSVAIQIGGLSALAPSRRGDFAKLGIRAMFAGLLACWMTACVASLFIPMDGSLAAGEPLPALTIESGTGEESLPVSVPTDETTGDTTGGLADD